MGKNKKSNLSAKTLKKMAHVKQNKFDRRTARNAIKHGENAPENENKARSISGKTASSKYKAFQVQIREEKEWTKISKKEENEKIVLTPKQIKRANMMVKIKNLNKIVASKGESNWQNPFRSEEAGKPLFIDLETLVCCNSGCVSCAYKIVAKPINWARHSRESFFANPKNDECLRIKLAKSIPLGKFSQIGLYNSNQTLLVLGDDDLSFSASLLENSDFKLFVFLTGNAENQNLQKYGDRVKILENVDLTKLEANSDLVGVIDKMIWNFPKNYENPEEDIETYISKVFDSAQELLIGEIHITNSFKKENKIPNITEKPNSDFQYKCSVVFDQSLFLGYKSEQEFINAKTYIFENITFFQFSDENQQKQSYFAEVDQELDLRNEKLLQIKKEENKSEPNCKELNRRLFGNQIFTSEQIQKNIFELKHPDRYMVKLDHNLLKMASLSLLINEKN